jgi:AbiV family abortive infection protein
MLNTMKREKLSHYKFEKLSSESFKNGLRLHFDSIILFDNNSYPSAYQLSILSLEEFSKSYWIEHYYFSSIGNNGFPEKEFEQEWLKLLYLHPKKQYAFFGWGDMYDYSPKFVAFVEKGGLEVKKQIATYVGLKKDKKNIDVNSRISVPGKISRNDAKQIISLINDYLKDICNLRYNQDYYTGIKDKDALINSSLVERLNIWKFKSGLRSRKWFSEWTNKHSS